MAPSGPSSLPPSSPVSVEGAASRAERDCIEALLSLQGPYLRTAPAPDPWRVRRFPQQFHVRFDAMAARRGRAWLLASEWTTRRVRAHNPWCRSVYVRTTAEERLRGTLLPARRVPVHILAAGETALARPVLRLHPESLSPRFRRALYQGLVLLLGYAALGMALATLGGLLAAMGVSTDFIQSAAFQVGYGTTQWARCAANRIVMDIAGFGTTWDRAPPVEGAAAHMRAAFRRMWCTPLDMAQALAQCAAIGDWRNAVHVFMTGYGWPLLFEQASVPSSEGTLAGSLLSGAGQFALVRLLREVPSPLERPWALRMLQAEADEEAVPQEVLDYVSGEPGVADVGPAYDWLESRSARLCMAIASVVPGFIMEAVLDLGAWLASVPGRLRELLRAVRGLMRTRAWSDGTAWVVWANGAAWRVVRRAGKVLLAWGAMDEYAFFASLADDDGQYKRGEDGVELRAVYGVPEQLAHVPLPSVLVQEPAQAQGGGVLPYKLLLDLPRIASAINIVLRMAQWCARPVASWLGFALAPSGQVALQKAKDWLGRTRLLDARRSLEDRPAVAAALAEGTTLLDEMAAGGLANTATFSLGRTRVGQFSDLLNSLWRAEAHGKPRMEPVCVYFWGDPGQGKDLSAGPILTALNDPSLADDPDRAREPLSLYIRNRSDAYWSSFCGQRALILTEFFQDKTRTERAKEALEFLTTVSAGPITVFGAAVDEKGQMLEPYVVGITGNVPQSNFCADIQDVGALKRRIDLDVLVHNDGGVVKFGVLPRAGTRLEIDAPLGPAVQTQVSRRCGHVDEPRYWMSAGQVATLLQMLIGRKYDFYRATAAAGVVKEEVRASFLPGPVAPALRVWAPLEAQGQVVSRLRDTAADLGDAAGEALARWSPVAGAQIADAFVARLEQRVREAWSALVSAVGGPLTALWARVQQLWARFWSFVEGAVQFNRTAALAAVAAIVAGAGALVLAWFRRSPRLEAQAYDVGGTRALKREQARTMMRALRLRAAPRIYAQGARAGDAAAISGNMVRIVVGASDGYATTRVRGLFLRPGKLLAPAHACTADGAMLREAAIVVELPNGQRADAAKDCWLVSQGYCTDFVLLNVDTTHKGWQPVDLRAHFAAPGDYAGGTVEVLQPGGRLRATGPVCEPQLVADQTYANGPVEYVLERALVAKHVTARGDCGSPWVRREDGLIVGIHLAGGDSSAAAPIDQDVFDQLVGTPLHAEAAWEPEFNAVNPRLRWQVAPPEFACHSVARASKLVPFPVEHADVWDGEVKRPSLRWERGGYYGPGEGLYDGLERPKYTLSVEDRTFVRELFEALHPPGQWPRCGLREAYEAMPLDTSPGVPYINRGIRKKGQVLTPDGWHPLLVQRLKGLQAYLRGEPTDYRPVCHSKAKDELLRAGKRVRLIEVVPVEVILAMIMVFKAWRESMLARQEQSYSAVGINPLGPQWAKLFECYVDGEGKLYDADGRNTDWNTFRDTTEEWARGLAARVDPREDGPWDHGSGYRAEPLLNMISDLWRVVGPPAGQQRPAIMYEVDQRNASGQLMTVELNGHTIACHHFLGVRDALREQGKPCSVADCLRAAPTKVYGDDLLGRLLEELQPGRVRALASTRGLPFTAGDKKEHADDWAPDPASVTFLKRGFLPTEGVVLAPLEMRSIVSSVLHHLKDDKGPAYSARAASAMMEAAVHGADAFAGVRTLVERCLLSKGWHYGMDRARQLPTYEEARAKVLAAARGAPVGEDWELGAYVHVKLALYPESDQASAPTVQESGPVTTFEDAGPAEQAAGVSLMRAVPVLPGAGAVADSPARFMERPYKVASYTWSTSQVRGTLLGTVNFPDVLLAVAQNAQKATNFRLLRAGVEFYLRLNGNQFVSGAIMASFDPATALDFASASESNLVTSSGFPNVVAQASEAVTPKLSIPYVWPWPFLDLATFPSGAIGSVDISVMSQLTAAAGATAPTVTVDVYAQFTNVVLSGPTYDTVIGTPPPVPRTWRLVPESDEDPLGVDYSTTAHSVARTSVEAVRASREAVKKSTLGLIGGVVGSLAKRAVGAVSGLVTTGVGVLRSVLGFDKPLTLQPVQRLVERFMPDLAASSGMDMSTALARLPPSQPVVLDQLASRGGDEMALATLAATPAISGYFPIPEGAVPGVKLGDISVNPKSCVLAAEPYVQAGNFNVMTIYPTPAAKAAWPFAWWRGTMRYALQVVCSPYYSCRLRLVFSTMSVSPGPASVAEGSYSRTYDVRGPQTLKLSVPFNFHLPYAAQSIGTISVYLETACPPIGDVAAPAADIVVWSSMAEDAAFRGLSGYTLAPAANFSWTDANGLEPQAPVPTLEAQSCMREEFEQAFEPIADSISVPLPADDALFHDRYQTVSELIRGYHLAIAPRLASSIALDVVHLLPQVGRAVDGWAPLLSDVPTPPFIPVIGYTVTAMAGNNMTGPVATPELPALVMQDVIQTDTTTQEPVVYHTPWDHFADCYKFQRGGALVRVPLQQATADAAPYTARAWAMTESAVTAAVGSDGAIDNQQYPVGTIVSSNGVLAVPTAVETGPRSLLEAYVPWSSRALFTTTGNGTFQGSINTYTRENMVSVGLKLEPAQLVDGLWKAAADDYRLHFIKGSRASYQMTTSYAAAGAGGGLATVNGFLPWPVMMGYCIGATSSSDGWTDATMPSISLA